MNQNLPNQHLDNNIIIDLASEGSSIEFLHQIPEYFSSLDIQDSSEEEISIISIEDSNSLSDFISIDSQFSNTDSSYILSSSCTSTELESLSTFPKLTLNSHPSDNPAPVEKSSESVPPVVYLAGFSEDLDLDSDLYLTLSFDSQDNIINCSNNFILETARKQLDKVWQQFEATHRKNYPVQCFSATRKYFQEGTQVKLDIANQWWKLINKYPVPQPIPPIALEL